MDYQAPKGTKDVLPQNSYKWQYLEGTMHDIARKYGFLEARTPVFEHTELFLRGVGDTTDIVQKEMYTFLDKGERSITLKPEGTAGFVRMFIENGLFGGAQPTKLYYINNPIFRYDRPQAGRLREHHQFGVEFFGSAHPGADAECIALLTELLNMLGCTDLSVLLNSIGCLNCRPQYQQALKAYWETCLDELCDTCKARREANPLRLLDCKSPRCAELRKDAPVILNFMCDDCRAHFERLQALLGLLEIPFVVTPMLVRGLDYYTRTVFEVVSGRIGAQDSICGGGRYDGLVEQLGGPPTPAVGFGLGMERLLLLLNQYGLAIDRPPHCDLYIASNGEAAWERALLLASGLRKRGLCVETDHMGRSMKAQFRYADKLGAPNILSIGEDELKSGRARIRRMSDGEQAETALSPDAIYQLIR